MSQYVSKAFMVLVHVSVENGLPQRESFVVGCSTREEAEAKIRSLYPSEQDIRLFALALSATETEGLDLTAGEIRRWQWPSPLVNTALLGALAISERGILARWSAQVDAVGCGHNGEQHEQGRSRSPPPQHGRWNQQQTRKHRHPYVEKDLREEFRCGLTETEKLSEVLLKLNETSLSQLRRDHETGHLDRKIVDASKWDRYLHGKVPTFDAGIAPAGVECEPAATRLS
jgi:hypothetical protein